MLASGAVLASAGVVTVYESRPGLGSDPAAARSRAAEAGSVASAERESPEAASERGLSRAERALQAAPAPSGANASTVPTTQAETLRQKLAEVMREKRDVEAQLRTLESELVRSADVPLTGDPREFDLDKADWKALAAEGRIKYRIPCMLPSGSAYDSTQGDSDALGLSPDDGKVVTEAHRGSNARVWATLRPLCMEAVGNTEVVDLLGAQSCLRLIEKVATSSDIMASADSRRRVAEVHAGMTPPPRPGEPQSPLFAALLAVTSEAEHFQADLAESFGPDEARRIYESMRCVSTTR